MRRVEVRVRSKRSDVDQSVGVRCRDQAMMNGTEAKVSDLWVDLHDKNMREKRETCRSTKGGQKAKAGPLNLHRTRTCVGLVGDEGGGKDPVREPGTAWLAVTENAGLSE